MRKYIVSSLFAFTLLFGAGVSVARPVYGEGTDDAAVDSTSSSTSNSILTEQQKQERATRIAQEREKLAKAKVTAQAKYQNAKQKVCTNRETEIKNVLNTVSTRATNHIAVFNKITERIKDFYTNKGAVLANYNQLVADVDAKKLAAEQSVMNLNDIAGVFTCNVDNPQASLQAVRDALHAKRDAMKAYRVSVKNLNVGVKSVQSTTVPSENKEVQQ